MKAKRHNGETPRESAYLYMYEYIGFNDMKLQKTLRYMYMYVNQPIKGDKSHRGFFLDNEYASQY